MKVLLTILLIGFSLCQSTGVKNLRTDEIYEVDLSEFPNKIIPSETIQYFRFPIEDVESIEFQLKTLHGEETDFNIDICGFAKLPTNEEVKKADNCLRLLMSTKLEEKTYDIYKYRLDVLTGVAFLGIHIENTDPLKYLSIYCTIIKEEEIKENYKLTDIYYKKELELDKTSLNEDYKLLVFRMEIDNKEINTIRVKVNKDSTSELELVVAGYKNKPNTVEDYQNSIELKIPEIISTAKDDKYTIYDYADEKINGAKYICIIIPFEKKYNYVSIYVGPEE